MAISIARQLAPEFALPDAERQYEFSVVAEHEIGGLISCISILDKLAEEAIEPNIFYESWMLLPALGSYAIRGRMIFLLVVATDIQDGSRCLCGFFPMEEKRFYRGVPLRHIALWRYPHCYLATPLLHRQFISQSLQALMDWFQSDDHYRLMVFNQISAHGWFHYDLDDVLANSALTYFVRKYERALFHPDQDAETYLAKAISLKARKEYQRMQRRLSERGEMRWEELGETDSVDDWINDFLQLEASGWKGRSGTALLSSQAGQKFFSNIATQAFKRRRLLLLALRLDGKPVAMIAVLLGGRGGYAFKMAYDENYSHYSPGVLLVLELNRRLHCREDFNWMDSCAAPTHGMANRLWLDRKPLRNIAIAKPYTPEAGMVRLLPALSFIKKSRIKNAARRSERRP